MKWKMSGWAWISSLRHVDLSGNMGIGREGVDLLADELPFWQQADARVVQLVSVTCAPGMLLCIRHHFGFPLPASAARPTGGLSVSSLYVSPQHNM